MNITKTLVDLGNGKFKLRREIIGYSVSEYQFPQHESKQEYVFPIPNKSILEIRIK